MIVARRRTVLALTHGRIDSFMGELKLKFAPPAMGCGDQRYQKINSVSRQTWLPRPSSSMSWNRKFRGRTEHSASGSAPPMNSMRTLNSPLPKW